MKVTSFLVVLLFLFAFPAIGAMALGSPLPDATPTAVMVPLVSPVATATQTDALQAAQLTDTPDEQDTPGPGSGPPAELPQGGGANTGLVVFGVVIVLAVIAAIIVLSRRRPKQK